MNIFSLIRRFPLNRSLRINCQRYASSSDAPVKFSSSEAKSWKAEFSRKGTPSTDEEAWFQPYVVIFSTAAFLYYFCVLREESDIDNALGKSIYEHVDGLEEVQLRKALEYNLNEGKDVRDIVARLKVLEANKATV